MVSRLAACGKEFSIVSLDLGSSLRMRLPPFRTGADSVRVSGVGVEDEVEDEVEVEVEVGVEVEVVEMGDGARVDPRKVLHDTSSLSGCKG